MRTETGILIRGIWEIVKEAFLQKIRTWNLPLPPFLKSNELSGITVIITGATSGIGLHTARELAMAGADVTMACRNIKLAKDIADGWRAEAHEKLVLKLEVQSLDLLSLSSVHNFAKEWETQEKLLHILINNAGAVYMKEPQKFTEDGIEHHMQVNHIAPALLTLLLLPSLSKASSSRIINVNSVGHHCAVVDPSRWNSRMPDAKFNFLSAYGESKLAQLMFLKTLAANLLEKNITSIKCIAVNPGIVKTKMVKPDPIPDWMVFWMLKPADGSRGVLFSATSAAALNLKKGFAYYSYTCKPAKPSSQTMDAHSNQLVWDKTLALLNLENDHLNRIFQVLG